MSPAKPPTDSTIGDAREAALRLLARVARQGVTSKETAAKVMRMTFSSDHVVRNATVSALVQITGRESQMALVNLLSDPNQKIQADAADALGQVDAPIAITPLKELLDHKDGGLALRAARALGSLKDRSGIPVVIRHLRTENAHTKLAAVVLGAIVGEAFRPNAKGIAEARRYLKRTKL